MPGKKYVVSQSVVVKYAAQESCKAASTKFDVPISTVYRWVKEAKEGEKPKKRGTSRYSY
jgi:transposase